MGILQAKICTNFVTFILYIVQYRSGGKMSAYFCASWSREQFTRRAEPKHCEKEICRQVNHAESNFLFTLSKQSFVRKLAPIANKLVGHVYFLSFGPSFQYSIGSRCLYLFRRNKKREDLWHLLEDISVYSNKGMLSKLLENNPNNYQHCRTTIVKS